MRTKIFVAALCCGICLVACKPEVSKEKEAVATVVEEVKEQTIYEKLGGAEGVSAIVDQIVDKHLENEKIAHYFEALKKDEAYFIQFKNHVKDFLGAGTGGAEQYSGRPMNAAHGGLNLSESDFLNAIDDILWVLDNNNVDRVSRNELLATLYGMKDVVIGQ